LLNQIEKILPDNDAKTYTSRVNVLKWEEVSLTNYYSIGMYCTSSNLQIFYFKVAFKHYSAEDCKARWVFIQEHLRHYRVLTELVHDAREWLEHPWHNFNSGSKV
jgi:upstream-binding transcription factor